MTNGGLNPSPPGLKRLSEELDVHIVAGCGFYVHAHHPAWVEDASVDDIEAFLVKEIEEGLGESGIRPGIIGEIGTSETLFPCEERILQASRTGRPADRYPSQHPCPPAGAASAHDRP